MGRGGGIGIGTVIILGIVGWALGCNPLYLIGGAEILSRLGGSQQQSQPAPEKPTAQATSDQIRDFVSAVLGSTEVQWREIFAQAGKLTEQQGWAVAYGFANTYESEEAEAKAAKRGIWAGTFVPPSQWRQGQNK
jgi:predicted metalloprotease